MPYAAQYKVVRKTGGDFQLELALNLEAAPTLGEDSTPQLARRRSPRRAKKSNSSLENTKEQDLQSGKRA